MPFVRSFIRRETVTSTSDEARQLVIEGLEGLPMIVWADNQTNGRGRGERSWWSDAGSLTFTIALDPVAHDLRTEYTPRLALTTGVAIIEAIAPMVPGVDLGIRWPNDVESGGRKLAGILPERVETPHGLRLLIGIGLNVRARLDDAPPEIRRMATSLDELGATLTASGDLEPILRAILGRFEYAVGALSRDDPTLAERWNQLDTLANRPVRVDLGARILTGRGAGIDALGGLLLASGREILTIYGGRVLRD